jgi:hypothetical protein
MNPNILIEDNTISKLPTALTNMIENQINEELLRQELSLSLKNQYINLYDLGHNYISDFSGDVLNTEILISMVNYIDDNYLNLEYKDMINDIDQNLFTLGIMLYEALFIDMVDIILPSLIKEEKLNINICDAKELKLGLLNVTKNILNGFISTRELSGGELNSRISENIIKYNFCLDLFDSDLERFLENFIIPVYNQYQTKIEFGEI